MNFLKSSLLNMGIIYPRFSNMGIPYPCFSYMGIILNILPTFKQHRHSVPTFKICQLIHFDHNLGKRTIFPCNKM